MPLRVDVGQHGHEEGGGVPLGEELPAAGLAELQGNHRITEVGKELQDHPVQPSPQPPHAC